MGFDEASAYAQLEMKLEEGRRLRGLLWPFKRGEVDAIVYNLDRLRVSINTNLQVYEVYVLAFQAYLGKCSLD